VPNRHNTRPAPSASTEAARPKESKAWKRSPLKFACRLDVPGEEATDSIERAVYLKAGLWMSPWHFPWHVFRFRRCELWGTQTWWIFTVLPNGRSYPSGFDGDQPAALRFLRDREREMLARLEFRQLELWP